jgi:hypothetical protein
MADNVIFHILQHIEEEVDERKGYLLLAQMKAKETKLLKAGKLKKIKITNGYALTTNPDEFIDNKTINYED